MPALRDFEQNPTDLRKARLVADDANNLIERLFKHEKAKGAANLDKLAYRRAAAVACPAFGLLWDVADARKHLSINREPRLVTNDEQTKVTGDFNDDFSNDFDVGRVVVEDNKGKIHEFEDALTAIASFLTAEMHRLGL